MFTDHSNELHQLLVSVSRHLWIAADGRVLYQKKPFDLSLEKVGQSPKNHLIHYLIRDHDSGHFYAEAGASRNLPPAEMFVFRAWSVKEKHSFQGLPETLSIPSTVTRVFPQLPAFVEGWGVHVMNRPAALRLVCGIFERGKIRSSSTLQPASSHSKKSSESHCCSHTSCRVSPTPKERRSLIDG